MVGTLGDGTPALSTVQKWVVELKRGRQGLEDDPSSGRSVTTSNEENIDHVR